MKRNFYTLAAQYGSNETVYITNVPGKSTTVQNEAKVFLNREDAVKEYDKRALEDASFFWSVVPISREGKSDIHLFNMFALNYPHDFIQKVWADSPEHIIGHIVTKFHSAYNVSGSYGAMLKFWSELDGGHREKLENWIIENYKG